MPESTRPHEQIPRIAEVSQPDADLEKTLAATMADATGRPLGIFMTLAQHPRLLKRFNAFAGTFIAHGTLPARERELVVLRTAWTTGSAYEWGQHVLIARDCGVTEAEINAITTENLDAWSANDALILRFCDEILIDTDVSDTTWAGAAELFNEAQLVELIMLVGLYRMVAGFLKTARVTPESYLPSLPNHT